MQEKIFLKSGKVDVKAIYDTETNKVTVLKGSIMQIETTAPSVSEGYKQIRDEIINNKDIIDNGVFLIDYEFSSPSSAVNVLVGSRNSGKKRFKLENGKELSTIKRPKNIDFIDYIIDNIDEFKDLKTKAEKEREEFRRKYPLESLKELKIEDYDRLGKKDSFMNMIENYTKSLGSGYLGSNKNKIFEHRGGDEYIIRQKILNDEENIGLSTQEIFKKFMNECYEFIKNFDVENYYSLNDYSGKKYLHEFNIIKGKLISIYCGDTPVITSINSRKSCRKIVSFLEIPHDANEDSIDLNIKLTKYVLEKAPELKDYSLIQLTHVIWKYYNEYIKEECNYYYVGSWIEDSNRKEEFFNSNIIAIGWENIGDLKEYSNDEEIHEKAREVFKESDAKYFKTVLNIFKNIKKGDKVILKTKGKTLNDIRIFAIGEVENDFEEGYKFIPGLGHSLPVKWEKIFEKPKEYEIKASKALQKIKGENLKIIKSIENDEYEESEGQEIITDKEIKGENTIYYGVPGCGKSCEVKKIASTYKMCERILFHQDYTYSDFVGQIQPILKEDEQTGKNTIIYEFVEGPFTKILGEALKDEEENYCLIIEEINRGNAPAIFGDIFQLLDRLSKDEDGYKKGDSEYRIKNAEIAKYLEKLKIDNAQEIYIPNNLSILATMNSSDQNVFPLDTAFKRRWKFKRISNKFDEKHEYKNEIIDGTNVTWMDFVEKINEEIKPENMNAINGEDKRLGKYFATKEEVQDKELFAEKVIFYLWEDVVKLNPQALFKPEYNTLDKVVEGFKDYGTKIFKDGIFNGENDDEE